MQPVDAKVRLLRLFRKIHGLQQNDVGVREDVYGNRSLHKKVDEEIFDLLWTLRLVARNDIGCLPIMELCLLWQIVYRDHFLQDRFLTDMLKLFEKQRQLEETSFDIVEALDSLSMTSSQKAFKIREGHRI